MFDYLTDTSVSWRRDDHRATKFVKSVKGKPFGGHLQAKINGRTRSFVHTDCGDVINHLARLMSAKILLLTEGPICLVPVPNSHVDDKDAEYKTLEFARKVSMNIPGRSSAGSAFHWKVARSPQHKAKGHRHKSQFIDKLKLCRLPSKPVVLLDDMVTSGSQMLACKDLLEARGCEVLFGITVGRLAEQQTKKPIGWIDALYHQNSV